MNEWVAIVSAPVVSAIVSCALIWFLRNWISERLQQSIRHEYAEERIKLKAELEVAHTVAREQLKLELGRRAYEHQIRFSRLHDRVVDAMAVIHLNLTRFRREVHATANDLSFDNLTLEQQYERARRAQRRFQRHYDAVRVYLPKPIDRQVHDFNVNLRTALRLRRNIDRIERQTSRGAGELNTTLDTMIEDTIPALWSSLEDEFRRMIEPAPVGP